jgi:hypothetical protein
LSHGDGHQDQSQFRGISSVGAAERAGALLSPADGGGDVVGILLAIDRARQVLGFEPRYSWRDHVQGNAN